MISHKPALTSHDFGIIKLEDTVKVICRNFKFSIVPEACVTRLAAVLRSKLEEIAQDTRMMMENSGRTQPAVSDVLAALKMRRFDMDQLVVYAKTLKNEQLRPLPIFPVPDYPATDKNYFHGMYGPKPSDLELQHRPEHIPDYYRAEYPELLKPKTITPTPKIRPKTCRAPLSPVSPPSSFFPNYEDMDYESLGFEDNRSPEPELTSVVHTDPEPAKTGQYAEFGAEHKKDMPPDEYEEYKRQKKERRRQKKEEPVVQKPKEPIPEPPVEKPSLKIRIKIDPSFLPPPPPPVIAPKLAEPESSATASTIEPQRAPLKIRLKLPNILNPAEPKVVPSSLCSEPPSTSEKAHKEPKEHKKVKRGRPKTDLELEHTVTQGAQEEGTVDKKIYICTVCSVVYDEGAAVIGCDRCQMWFHWACVEITTEPPADSSWFCKKCSKKIQKEKRRSEHRISESTAKRQKQ